MQGTIQYPRGFVYLDFYEEKKKKRRGEEEMRGETHAFLPTKKSWVLIQSNYTSDIFITSVKSPCFLGVSPLFMWEWPGSQGKVVLQEKLPWLWNVLHSLFGFINKPVFLRFQTSLRFFFASSSKPGLPIFCPALGHVDSFIASLKYEQSST